MATKKEEHLCGFVDVWFGRCETPVEPEGSRCDRHDLKCSSCGEPATHLCDQTGQLDQAGRFVCDSPLCDDCQHLIWPNGSNGGVGFNAMELPEGFAKRHVRKSEQPDWNKESKKRNRLALCVVDDETRKVKGMCLLDANWSVDIVGNDEKGDVKLLSEMVSVLKQELAHSITNENLIKLLMDAGVIKG